jgi:hypothetical protein
VRPDFAESQNAGVTGYSYLSTAYFRAGDDSKTSEEFCFGPSLPYRQLHLIVVWNKLAANARDEVFEA